MGRWSFARIASIAVAGGVFFAIAACGLILQLDQYHSCTSNAPCLCDGGQCTNAEAEASAPRECSTIDDCRAKDPTYTMCTSAGTCRKVEAIARGSSIHICALLDDGSIVCWGTNGQGQLGRGTTSPYEQQPQIVPGIPSMQFVGVGLMFTCALSTLGQVYCWGTGTGGGGTLTPTLVNLPIGRQAHKLSVGQADACALLDDLSIYCWGDNQWGVDGCSQDAGLCSSQDGGTVTPTPAFPSNPRLLADGSEGYLLIAVGVYQTCAAISSGQVHCWGVGDHLGVDPTTQNLCCSQSDLAPAHGNNLQDLVSTEFYACRQDDVGEFDCWGDNDSCVFENFNCGVSQTPVALPNIDRGATIAAGWRHLCWRSNGTVFCRGDAQYSDLGDDDAGLFSVINPVEVLGLTATVSDLAANRFFSCAKQTDGQVMCWGGNGSWLLGLDGVPNGPDITQATPVNWGNP